MSTARKTCLSFRLKDGWYAVDVSIVSRVLQDQVITPLPRMPDFVKGVIDYEDTLVPVVDLAMKLDFEAVEITPDASFLIAELVHDGQPLKLGLLVDAVREVFEVEEQDIKALPHFDHKIDDRLISGLAPRGEGLFATILDLQHVFHDEELALVQTVASAD